MKTRNLVIRGGKTTDPQMLGAPGAIRTHNQLIRSFKKLRPPRI